MDSKIHAALKNYRDNIESHLEYSLAIAQNMQQVVFTEEGDSDLNRYLSFYLIPALTHWTTGAQAGNMKFLKELLDRRESEGIAKQQQSAKIVGGGEILTDPEK